MTNANISEKKERVIAYIDGFNLYFGLMEAGLDYCRWLNLDKLIKRILKPHEELITINYYTSRINGDPEKLARQSTYLEALETVDVKIFYGVLERKPTECNRCGKVWYDFNEKMTDVNIACQLLIDAYQDKIDTAVLISGDTDLSPPIKSIHSQFKDKRVFIAFPPKRHRQSLALLAKGSMVIGRANLVESQFEEKVIKSNGHILRKPQAS